MRRLFLAIAVLGATLLPASSALAAPHHPTGTWANFSDCPLNNAKTDICVYSKTLSGSVTTGAKKVPIVNAVTLQGGLDLNPETGATTWINAEDGNTLSKTPQPVPGGLLGVTAPAWWPKVLRDLFNETINKGFTGVNATVELAGPPVQFQLLALLAAEGTAVVLPVKIKLDNPFLGSNCYIGSSSSPITIALTVGTTAPPPPNTPITGSQGEIVSNEAGSYIKATGTKLVGNSFSVPGANGCGGILFSWAVDPLVESIVGVPAAAGKNTAILEGNTELGQSPDVKASE
jgi:hypothetical protein